MRLLTIDPSLALGSDYFALILGDIELGEKVLYIKGAKRWLQHDITLVESEIEQIWRTKLINKGAIEINGVGSLIAKGLENKGVDLQKIMTVGRPTLYQSRYSDSKMIKEEMVAYLVQLREQERIFFPEILPNPKYDDLRTLKAEWTQLQANPPRTGVGTTRYEAPSGEHDDLIMALMLMAFIAKPHLDRGTDYVSMASKKYNPYGRDDPFGSGVPKSVRDIRSLDRDVSYP